MRPGQGCPLEPTTLTTRRSRLSERRWEDPVGLILVVVHRGSLMCSWQLVARNNAQGSAPCGATPALGLKPRIGLKPRKPEGADRALVVPLQRNKWFEVERSVSEMRIRLGERARKLVEAATVSEEGD